MLPEKERIPYLDSLLEAAQELKDNNSPPSPEFMREVFEVVRLTKLPPELIQPLFELIFVVESLDLKTNEDILSYWRGIVVNAVLVLNNYRSFIPNAKAQLITLFESIDIDTSLDSNTSIERLAHELESHFDEPNWLLGNIEYRFSLVGKGDFEDEYQVAIHIMSQTVTDQYVFMLASFLASESCIFSAQYKEAFVYGQQLFVLAEYLGKPFYKLGALMAMLPALLATNPKNGEPNNPWLAKEIIDYWEKHSINWKTPRQEALYFSMVGPFYLAVKDYELAERYLKKAVQLLEYLEDQTNVIRMQIALGMALTQLEDYRRAIFWCEEAASEARKQRQDILVSWAMHAHGWALLKAEQYEEAFKKLADALNEAWHLNKSEARRKQLYGIGDELLNVLEKLEYSEVLDKIRDDLLRLVEHLPHEEWVDNLKDALVGFKAENY